MIRLIADKIAAATKNVPLRNEVRCRKDIVATEGYLVAGRIHGEKAVYNTLENTQGRMVPLHDGDIVVGVLGHRKALQGYSGEVPQSIRAGDQLHVLNLGGVIGKCTSVNPDVGEPFVFEVLGTVLVFPEFGSRTGVPAHVGMNAIRGNGSLGDCPVVFVVGTSMNSGKTLASCHIIRTLATAGIKVGACKLTGVSLLRDTLHMSDYGAAWAVSFMDAGIVTTDPDTAVSTARTLISHLAHEGADVIVAELGDGLLGQYGVRDILADPEIARRCNTLILCANDPVGAWGGMRLLCDELGLTPHAVSGPTTDNAVGTSYIEQSLGVRAINARSSGRVLGAHVLERVRAIGGKS